MLYLYYYSYSRLADLTRVRELWLLLRHPSLPQGAHLLYWRGRSQASILGYRWQHWPECELGALSQFSSRPPPLASELFPGDLPLFCPVLRVDAARCALGCSHLPGNPVEGHGALDHSEGFLSSMEDLGIPGDIQSFDGHCCFTVF